MALYNINEILGNQTQTDINKIDIANNNEIRMELVKAAGNLASATYRNRSMFSDAFLSRDGKQFTLYDMVVKQYSADRLRDGNAIGIDRKVDLTPSVFTAGNTTSILPGEPKQGRQFLGFYKKTAVSIEKNRMAFGSFRITNQYSKWAESLFSWDMWTSLYSSMEQELAFREDQHMRATVFGVLPTSLGESDGITDAELETEYLPTFGGGFNETDRVDVLKLHGRTSLEDFQYGDGFDEDVLRQLSAEMAKRRIAPISTENGMYQYGLLLSQQDIIEFQYKLSDTSQAMMNNSDQGNGDYQNSMLYRMGNGAILQGWNNWTFFLQDRLSSDPTVIEYLDESGKLQTKPVPEMSLQKEAAMRRYNGSVFAPSAYVVGLVKGDTTFTNLLDFSGPGNKERVDLAAGNKDDTNNYLLLSEQGAMSLSYFYEKGTGHATAGSKSPYAKEGGISATEAALTYCHLDAGSQVGELQVSKPSQTNNGREWKIVYSGPFHLGSVSKGLNGKQVVPSEGSTVIDTVMAVRIEAIYKKDNSTTTFTLVDDAGLAAELAIIKDDLEIDTDGIIKPTIDDATGQKQVVNEVFERRRASYFDTVLTMATGMYSIIELVAPGDMFSGTEEQNFGAFQADAIGKNVGRKLNVDPMYQMPIGALGILYKPSHIVSL